MASVPRDTSPNTSSTSCSSIFVPRNDTIWSSADSASRSPPSAPRAMAASASSDTSQPSADAISRSRPEISFTPIRRKSNRWHRDRIVFGTLCTSVVARKNFAWAGGSSSVLSSALNAPWLSMCTSSMM